MIARLIDYSIENRFLVILIWLMVVLGGIFAVFRIPIDAIPDLSDTQVIIYTEYSGQAPRIVEDQITYPLTSSMLSVPGVRNVRGYSFFGFSLVYLIFEDGTDIYWARSRVLEYLNYASSRLPTGVKPSLGPDATGVGWVYMYTVTDSSGKLDLQELRSIQDWQIRYELSSLEGVAEVASLGGFVKQYQIEADPTKLILYNVSLQELKRVVERSNMDTGGRLIEMGETEYMVRGMGYFKSLEDIRNSVIRTDEDGNPVVVGDVARVQIGPEIRRGIAEWNGEGETVAGIVVIRSGENALDVIDRVKERIHEIRLSLPGGVKINGVYDRSLLIHRSIAAIFYKLMEEMTVVSVVIAIFLLHFRSSLVAVITLPIGILASLLLMYVLDINANIMSLGGIAIAIGVMVDAAVVMVENLHKVREHREDLSPVEQAKIAAREVGPALFFSLLIITVSFLPVLVLGEQSGRLFRPLALTKTFAMAFSSLIAVTLIPVLLTFFVTGRTRRESEHPISRYLISAYKPLLNRALDHKRFVLFAALAFTLLSIIPITGIPWFSHRWLIRPMGGEFMPPVQEGDILYMPTTLPGISITKARELLQRTDALIKEVPEVDYVLGKIGRAETATDPAPLTMIESTIILKDPSLWRPGVDMSHIVGELDHKIQFPGLTNAWTMPIRTRIDMLSTGIKTPVGVKILGEDLEDLSFLASRLEAILREVDGSASVIADRVMGGKYMDYVIDRHAAARYGLTVGDIQDTIMTAVGGMNVTYTVEGLARYPVNIRYPRELRDNPEALKNIYITNKMGAAISISQVADLRIKQGPPGIKSENARPTAWIYIDLKPGVDVAGFVNRAKQRLHEAVDSGELLFPPGVTLVWSGQFEYMERSRERLFTAGAVTLVLVILLLYIHFNSFSDTILIALSLLFAVTGGIWFLYIPGYNTSVATGVGFIALAGLAAETGIVMLVYLKHSIEKARSEGRLPGAGVLREAILEGAAERVRPKVMTVATTLLGLLPILWTSSLEPASAVMKRLAAPMIGGLITSTVLTLFILPLIYEWIYNYKIKNESTEKGED